MDDILRGIEKGLIEEEDFFEIVDSAGLTFQMRLEGDKLWIEIPVPSERGSYGKMVERKELENLIFGVAEHFSTDMFSEMKFQSWF